MFFNHSSMFAHEFFASFIFPVECTLCAEYIVLISTQIHIMYEFFVYVNFQANLFDFTNKWLNNSQTLFDLFRLFFNHQFFKFDTLDYANK